MGLNGSSGDKKDYQFELAIKVNGSEVSQTILQNILQVVVEESLYMPSMFTIVIRNDLGPGGEGDRIWQYDQFTIGQKITIGFAMVQTQVFVGPEQNPYLCQGKISAVQIPFSKRSQAPIVIRGYSEEYPLHLGRINRTFVDQTDSQIVRKILTEHGLEIDRIDDTGVRRKHVYQANITNMEFIRQLAVRNGYEFYSQFDTQKKTTVVGFCKSHSRGKLKTKWLDKGTSGSKTFTPDSSDLIVLDGIRLTLNAAEQVKKVKVNSWFYQKKELIHSEKSKNKTVVSESDALKADDVPGKMGGGASELSVVNLQCQNPEEADHIAQGICDRVRGEFLQAEIEAEGNPKVKPGKVIELQDEDLGRYKGEYYIGDTRHVYQPDRERTYTVHFTIRGLKGGNLVSSLSSPNQLEPGQTLLIGLVTDNEDPDNMGRVKVKFPTLTEEHTSYWARVVSVGGGKKRGVEWLPEIDDEVLVGFEHGNINKPYVVGGLWNGKDEPPTNVKETVVDNKVRLRTLQSRVGHIIQLIDEDKGESKTGIHIITEAGHQIYLNDSDKKILIKSKAGHTIELNDATKTMNIESIGNLNIKAAGNITIQGVTIALN